MRRCANLDREEVGNRKTSTRPQVSGKQEVKTLELRFHNKCLREIFCLPLIHPKDELITEGCNIGRQAIDELLECDPHDVERFLQIAMTALRQMHWLTGRARRIKATR